MWNPDGENSQPLEKPQGYLMVKTPEENFKSSFKNFPATRENYGVRVLKGRLVITEPELFYRGTEEQRTWITECLQEWNTRL